jgi:hypothetical protein
MGEHHRTLQGGRRIRAAIASAVIAFKQFAASGGVLWRQCCDIVGGEADPSERGWLNRKGLGWRIIFSGDGPCRYWSFLYSIDRFTGDSVENKE